MRVIVFGATGSVGRLAVEQLLQQGHEVTAFARRPERLGIEHPALRRHAGDALLKSDVSAAVEGQDAVIVALGAGASRTSRIRSQGTLNIIQAMQSHGVRRLICQSTLGAQESWSNLNFWWKRVMFGLLLRPVFKDHELQERLVEASGLDWTILRPSAFSDTQQSVGLREGFGPEERGLKLSVPRSAVAAFLVRQIADLRNLHRAVALSA
ncbi:MAG: NAD(P)-binding oxidoreductase [Pseudomonadota bacterium]